MNDVAVGRELKARGFMSVPVTFVDGRGLPGFDRAELSRALGLEEVDVPVAPRVEGAGELLGDILGAWARAVRQLPAAHLSRWAGVEDYDLRRYAYVIPQHVEVTMLARETGTWDAAAHFEDEGWRAHETSEGLARYTESVRAALAEWSSTLGREEAGRICSGFYGQLELSRLVELSLARCAFHLRRLCRVLQDELGIEPEQPIADAELRRIAGIDRQPG